MPDSFTPAAPDLRTREWNDDQPEVVDPDRPKGAHAARSRPEPTEVLIVPPARRWATVVEQLGGMRQWDRRLWLALAGLAALVLVILLGRWALVSVATAEQGGLVKMAEILDDDDDDRPATIAGSEEELRGLIQVLGDPFQLWRGRGYALTDHARGVIREGSDKDGKTTGKLHPLRAWIAALGVQALGPGLDPYELWIGQDENLQPMVGRAQSEKTPGRLFVKPEPPAVATTTTTKAPS